MNINHFPIAKTDPEVKHLRALANVYEFLLKLAESAKRQPEDSVPSNEPEKETIASKENIPP